MDTATPSGGNEFRQGDASFTGSIPEGYERRLVPLLFAPYAADLCERVVSYSPSRVLEIAAGTGVVTRELALALPQAWIVATDLNQAMIDMATKVVQSPNVQFQQADAGSLPFDGASMDVVVAQFGAMFFPDKVAAFREARRVLRGDGAFIFNVWNDFDGNEVDGIISRVFKKQTGEACFLERIPFAYSDPDRVAADLKDAGFDDVTIDIVNKSTIAGSVIEALDALIDGTPLSADFEKLGINRAAHVRSGIVDALVAEYGEGEFTNAMSALVITAR